MQPACARNLRVHACACTRECEELCGQIQLLFKHLHILPSNAPPLTLFASDTAMSDAVVGEMSCLHGMSRECEVSLVGKAAAPLPVPLTNSA